MYMYLRNVFQYKKLIHGDNKADLQVWERLIAGSAAGATAQTIIYPGEVSWSLFYNGYVSDRVTKFSNWVY